MGVAPDFRTVFDEHFAYVRRNLRRLGVPDRDLNDQTQEVFLTVHGLLPDFDATRPLRPWLFGVTYRFALRYRALARHRREVAMDGPEPRDVAPGADELAAQAQERELVRAALDCLETRRCAVFVMGDIEGFTAPEIAAALDVPLNTVYSRLRLARSDFKAAVRRLRARRGDR